MIIRGSSIRYLVLSSMIIILVNPINGQNNDTEFDGSDSNLIGVKIGEKFSFFSDTSYIFHYYDVEQGQQHYIPPNSKFNMTIKGEPEDRSPDNQPPWYNILTEFEFNGSSHDIWFSLHLSNSRTITIYYVLFTDWEYYDGVLRSEYDEKTEYTTNHQFMIGKTKTEFVVIESFDHSSQPVGISSAIIKLDYEVRYDLETGVLNYLSTSWSMSRDFGPPYTIHGSTTLYRNEYEILATDNINPIREDNDEANLKYSSLNLILLPAIIVIIRVIKSKQRHSLF